MKYFFISLLSLMVLLQSCNNKKITSPTTDADVATYFIRNVLDDNFKDAEPYLLKDEANTQYFERFKQEYEKKDKEELKQFKNADIIIKEIVKPNDSLRIFKYSNSYKKNVEQQLKLVWQNNKWAVDLKHTFTPTE